MTIHAHTQPTFHAHRMNARNIDWDTILHTHNTARGSGWGRTDPGRVKAISKGAQAIRMPGHLGSINSTKQPLTASLNSIHLVKERER